MKAKSIKGKSIQQIKSQLQQCRIDGFKPTVCIVFVSIKHDRNELCKLLDDEGIAVFGATSNGEFVNEDVEQGTAALLLLDVNPQYFFIQYAELNGRDDKKITRNLCKEALEKFKKPAFIVAASNLQTDAEDFLKGFSEAAGDDVNVFGGMAGDDNSFTEQYVFTNHSSGSRAIVNLVFDEEKIIIKGRATSGWKAVGTEKTVTKSEGSRIYTIDNIPALDIALKFSGLSKDDENLPIELVTNFPFQLQRPNGNPLMRPPYRIHWEDHSLTTGGKVPEGSKIKFSLPPDFDVIEKVIHECEDLKATEMPVADALIIFNCSGRMLTFGPLMSKEIEGVQNVWKVPLVGMFSNAELGRATNGKLEMHNLTTCCVVIKEK